MTCCLAFIGATSGRTRRGRPRPRAPHAADILYREISEKFRAFAFVLSRAYHVLSAPCSTRIYCSIFQYWFSSMWEDYSIMCFARRLPYAKYAIENSVVKCHEKSSLSYDCLSMCFSLLPFTLRLPLHSQWLYVSASLQIMHGVHPAVSIQVACQNLHEQLHLVHFTQGMKNKKHQVFCILKNS